MSKFALFLFALIVSLSTEGQTTIESESYGVDQYIEKCSDIPVLRRINGGTVFKIKYEPEYAWDNSMKGAFEYACKIWEEQLPNTLPINICAKIDGLRSSGGSKLLSKVQPRWFRYDGVVEYNTRIKYMLLEEYNKSGNTNGYCADSTNNNDFFDLTDIEIIYNENLLDEFSFSLYSTPIDKYDFVTIVLRDIAKGLGFISDFTARNGAFDNMTKPLTYYERIIKEAINADNLYEAYHNSTQGSLPLYVYGYGNLNLYAPTAWKNGVSLNYFIPDAAHKFTELLTYDLGRGTVNRNIVDNYDVLLNQLQGWYVDFADNLDASEIKDEGNTGNLIDYNGDVTIMPSSTGYSYLSNVIAAPRVSRVKRKDPNRDEGEFNLESYLLPFNYRYPDMSGNGSWIVSLLKKDGTWDCVYSEPTMGLEVPLEINMSDLNISSNNEQYQRTCDGYLRCRITNFSKISDNSYDIKNYYYVLDYLPQKVKMGFNPDDEFNVYDEYNVNSNNIVANTRSYSPEDDEYTQEIKINIKDLEGIDRVVVEQLDEGNELPVRFEVPDFKKGYFTAIVDKELYTDFVVCSYNKNGSVRSEIFTVDPLDPYPELFDISVSPNNISLSKIRRAPMTGLKYEIYNTSGRISLLKSGTIEDANSSIDISDLGLDLYTLKIKQNNFTIQQIKFQKMKPIRR